jgi:hypothetical protein
MDSLVQQDLVGSHVWKMFALLSCCGQTHISRGKHTGLAVMTVMQQPELSRAWHGAA